MQEVIKIGGAGISGLTAAINLAKAGYKVKVFDAAKDSGVRFNNDFQGLENWAYEQDALDFLKDINIELNFYCHGADKASLWAPDGCHGDLKLSRSAYYLVKRGVVEDSLDQALKNQALSLGVEIFYNQPIKPEDVNIVATGPFRYDPNTYVMAAGYTFETNLGDCHIGILDDACAPDGYSYFLVNEGRATIASCIFRNYNNLSEYREKTLGTCRRYKTFEMENAKKFSGTGNFFLPKIPKDKKIYIGEAGGFQDYLFFFGMKYAMKSGYYAAKSIIDGGDFYKLCQKDLIPRMKASVVNRLIFSIFGKRAYKRLVKNCSKADSGKFAGELYKYSLSKKTLFPIAAVILRKNINDPRSL